MTSQMKSVKKQSFDTKQKKRKQRETKFFYFLEISPWIFSKQTAWKKSASLLRSSPFFWFRKRTQKN